MRLGVLGGTFDPPHKGHLRLAAAALDQLGLSRVLWVVTADPPHKQSHEMAPVADRLAMVAAAIAGQTSFELSRVDVDRAGPHWAVDTVALLAQRHPGAEMVYLMGGDSLRDLPSWGRPNEFLATARLGVLRRPGDRVDLEALEKFLPGISGRVDFIEAAPDAAASYDIRRRVRDGLPVDDLLPPDVADYIRAHALYRPRLPNRHPRRVKPN